MVIKKLNSVQKIDSTWDQLCQSVYQKLNFLSHLEEYNECKQRYYLAYEDDCLKAGAIVYSLDVNLLTFASQNLSLPMTIVGVPASVDAEGFIGDDNFREALISKILNMETGTILCLNYNEPSKLRNVIEMKTMPTMIFECHSQNWEAFIQSIKHNYRRRIIKAQEKLDGIKVKTEQCSNFSKDHYQLYLNIMKRTKTKLELLSDRFFVNLPLEYKLRSFFVEDKLISWHITTTDNGIYYFLFGGLDYDYRKKYDSYFNNLINILKDGLNLNSIQINFGQTAEISKNRLGARLVEKRMFLYHKNVLFRGVYNLLKGVLGYKINSEMVNIYKINSN